VPTTQDVITTLFNPAYPKSHLDLLNLCLLGFQIVLYFVLSRKAAQIFFFFYFAFWRAAYDGGLGWVLTKQSKKKWIVREIQRLGWLDEKTHPEIRNWIKKQLVDKMGKDYSFDVSSRTLRVSINLLTRPLFRNCHWSIIHGFCSGRRSMLFLSSTLSTE
jgi:phosphatidylethanolamine N-methyltransferase